MRFNLRTLAATALATAATSSFAAALPPAVVVTAPVQRVEIVAPSSALAAAEVVIAGREAEATYLMSTGHRMSVTAVGDAVLVRVDRRTAKLLRHDGRGRFVSANGALALQFQLDDRGDPQAARLTVPGGWL